MGLTHFPHGVSSFGVPQAGGGVMPVGGGRNSPARAFWVDPTNGSDGNNGLSPDKALSTLSQAHSMMTANQNDTAYVIGNSGYTSSYVVSESASLAWSKSLCHIVGVNAFNRISHRVSIRAVTNNFTPLVNVTADGCVFANFHVFAGYDSDVAQIAWTETGKRNSHYNLHIGGMGHQTAADNTGGRSVKLTGDGERYFKDCTIGLDTIDRGVANYSLELSGQVNRDIFEDCRFIMHADSADARHVLVNGLDRFANFKNCQFINSAPFTSSATTLTGNITVSSAGGVIMLNNCQSVGSTEWESTASGKVYVEVANSAAETGIMVAATT